MGEATLQAIERLKNLPHGVHWCCPRTNGEDDTRYFLPEDIQITGENDNPQDPAEREKLLADAAKRKHIVLEALMIFSFDSREAVPHQEWLENVLSQRLKCDVCVREFHRGREELREQLLREQYEEDDVKRFFEVVDNMNRRRIQRGLATATNKLRNLPKEQRRVSSLDMEDFIALFETLNCPEILQDSEFLSAHFDEPLSLVQQNKKLRLLTFPPAMGYFLFMKDTANSERRWLAYNHWNKLKRVLTAKEWELGIKPAFHKAMLRVQLHDLDKQFLSTFWIGARHIIEALDQSQITHRLRAMDLDIIRLALDHLQIPGFSIRELLSAISAILYRSPADFWGAMGTIPASTWIDQVFNSPALMKQLSIDRVDPKPDRVDGRIHVVSFFQWVLPFMSSIRAINKAAVCRHLSNQLLLRFQRSDIHEIARKYTYHLGLQVLATTLQTIVCQESISGGSAAVVEILEPVDGQIDRLVALELEDDGEDDTRSQSLSVIRWALALDCKCVCLELKSVALREQLPQAKLYSGQPKIWRAVSRGIERNMILGRTALIATAELAGFEKFVTKSSDLQPDEKAWNESFDTLNSMLVDCLEQVNGCDPADVQTIFDDQEATDALVVDLFASDPGVRNAAMEIFKNISDKTIRQQALGDALRAYFPEILSAFSSAFRTIRNTKSFAAASSMLRIGKDVLEIMCNSTDGALRSSTLTDKDKDAAEKFWQAMWNELGTIFTTTEEWNNRGHPRPEMNAFVANTIEFSRHAFDQIAVFTGALCSVTDKKDDREAVETRLIREPKGSMDAMVQWLRLRDDALSGNATELICNLLKRLKGLQTRASGEAITYIKDVLRGVIKTLLNDNRKAELQSALETHIGEPIELQPKQTLPKMERVKPTRGNQTIDLESWAKKSQGMPVRKNEALEKIIAASSTGHDALQKRSDLAGHKALLSTSKRPELPRPSDSADFKKKREEEKAAKLRQNQEIVANAKRRATGRNANEGSGVLGIGNIGKDHSKPKGSGIMISSDESSSEDDDDDDLGLFGPSKKTTKKQAGNSAYDDARAKAWAQQKAKGPVKKQRINRTAQDMRARLAPNLSPLHESILRWDFFHDGPFPPNSSAQEYAEVLSKFRDPISYQNTFQPLLLLEAWNGFLKAREELQAKPYNITVANRSSVDSFVEVGGHVSVADGKELAEGDIVLLSKAESPADEEQEPHCLARIQKIGRKKAKTDVVYRVLPGSPLIQALSPDTTIFGLKVMSIIPLEREFGALRGLQYYDLCDEIAKGKPSPLLTYTDQKLDPLMSTYNVNKAQAKAIQSALDNDAFTLVQGPPGSGKTKTIVAIVGALLTDALRNAHPIAKPVTTATNAGPRSVASKKLLVCAPSNAAVDELVMRFKEGIKMSNGEDRKVSVVRLGRSDAININVQDVTLDELINKRLNINREDNNKNVFDETRKIMTEHQSISRQFDEARSALQMAEAQKEDTSKLTSLRKEFDELRRSKAIFSQKVDAAKDAEQAHSTRAEQNRRRVQQEIIEGAHVICATLSGSGHDMFQNLNVEFETVVIDEAAQCVELSALIPLKYGCAKCVLVGDPQQLPPTVFSKEAARFKYEQSLFVRMQGNHPDDVHLLDTQYRMHPEISAFPREAFYQSKLVDGPNMAALRTREWHAAELLGPFRFFDVQGQHESAVRGHSLINKAEIRVALQLYERLQTDFRDYNFKGKIGIITPYKSQLRELREQFKQRYGSSIGDQVEFNTTDAFQGRESEVIIFSCVRASPGQGIGFLQDIRRMNVGLTRAKSSLWVLGNSQSLQKGDYWNKLIVHARTSGYYTSGNIEGLLRKPSKMITNAADMMKQAAVALSTNGTGSNGQPPTDRKPSKPSMDKQNISKLSEPDRKLLTKNETASSSNNHGSNKDPESERPIKSERDTGSGKNSGLGKEPSFGVHEMGMHKRKLSRDDAEGPMKKKPVPAPTSMKGEDHKIARTDGAVPATKKQIPPLERIAAQRRPARPSAGSVFLPPKKKRRD